MAYVQREDEYFLTSVVLKISVLALGTAENCRQMNIHVILEITTKGGCISSSLQSLPHLQLAFLLVQLAPNPIYLH